MWLRACPEHGVTWFKGRYGLAHKSDDCPKGYCNLKDIFKGWILARQEQLDWGNDRMKEWLKDHYGTTWSQIPEEKQAEAIHKLGLEAALTKVPEESEGEPETGQEALQF